MVDNLEILLHYIASENAPITENHSRKREERTAEKILCRPGLEIWFIVLRPGPSSHGHTYLGTLRKDSCRVRGESRCD